MLAALVHPHPPKPLLFGCPQAALGLGAGEVEGAVVQAIGKRIIEVSGCCNFLCAAALLNQVVCLLSCRKCGVCSSTVIKVRLVEFGGGALVGVVQWVQAASA